MKRLLMVIVLSISPLILASCGVGMGVLPHFSLIDHNDYKFEYESPVLDSDPQIDLDKLREKLVCSKEESEQDWTQEALDNRIVVKAKAEYKDIEYVNCDGEVVRRDKGYDSAMVEKKVRIAPPEDLSQTVSFAEISNARTCMSWKEEAAETKTLSDEVLLPDGTEIKLLSDSIRLSETGEALLTLTTRWFKDPVKVNVKKGLNLVTVRYFGKCLEYRKDINENLGDDHNCLNAEWLATKQLAIDLKVELIGVDGMRRVSVCSQDKSDEAEPSL